MSPCRCNSYNTIITRTEKQINIATICWYSWASKARVGTGGRVPRSQKISGGRPPRNDYILASFFLHTDENFAFSTIFKIKCPKSEEKLNFGGRWVWVPMNPSSPKQNFVATPLLVLLHCQSQTPKSSGSSSSVISLKQSTTKDFVIDVISRPLFSAKCCRAS